MSIPLVINVKDFKGNRNKHSDNGSLTFNRGGDFSASSSKKHRWHDQISLPVQMSREEVKIFVRIFTFSYDDKV